MSIRGVTTSESETFLGSLRLSNFLIDLDEFYEGKSEREDSYRIRRIVLQRDAWPLDVMVKRIYVDVTLDRKTVPDNGISASQKNYSV